MFLEEGEDPLEVIKEKTKKPAEKSVDAKTSVKPVEVKGKAGGAPTQPATAVKKTAVLKETQANVIKPAEQNKPREGEILNIQIFFLEATRRCCDLEPRQRGDHVVELSILISTSFEFALYKCGTNLLFLRVYLFVMRIFLVKKHYCFS